jgi:hypothetical protein
VQTGGVDQLKNGGLKMRKMLFLTGFCAMLVFALQAEAYLVSIHGNN